MRRRAVWCQHWSRDAIIQSRRAISDEVDCQTVTPASDSNNPNGPPSVCTPILLRSPIPSGPLGPWCSTLPRSIVIRRHEFGYRHSAGDSSPRGNPESTDPSGSSTLFFARPGTLECKHHLSHDVCVVSRPVHSVFNRNGVLVNLPLTRSWYHARGHKLPCIVGKIRQLAGASDSPFSQPTAVGQEHLVNYCAPWVVDSQTTPTCARPRSNIRITRSIIKCKM